MRADRAFTRPHARLPLGCVVIDKATRPCLIISTTQPGMPGQPFYQLLPGDRSTGTGIKYLYCMGCACVVYRNGERDILDHTSPNGHGGQPPALAPLALSNYLIWYKSGGNHVANLHM